MTAQSIVRSHLRSHLGRDPTDSELAQLACAMIDYMAPAYSEAMRRGMRGKHAPVAGSTRGDVDKA